jgi:hypothetical protein
MMRSSAFLHLAMIVEKIVARPEKINELRKGGGEEKGNRKEGK